MKREVGPAVYTVPEMAILLHISEWMVYERVRKGEIPGVKRFGSKIRFLKAIINAWLGIDADGAAEARAS